MTQLPAPENKAVSLVNIIIDGLIKGFGVEVIYTLAVAEAPWLGLPFIGYIFKLILNKFAASLDANLKRNIDIVIIRFQNDARKAEYDSAIEKLKKPEVTDAELQAAKDAIDKLVHRAK
jgi:hypothetical protein